MDWAGVPHGDPTGQVPPSTSTAAKYCSNFADCGTFTSLAGSAATVSRAVDGSLAAAFRAGHGSSLRSGSFRGLATVQNRHPRLQKNSATTFSLREVS